MSLAEFLRSLPCEDEVEGGGGTGGGPPLNDDAWLGGSTGPLNKKARTSQLGLGITDDFFTVPEIQRRALPREDGYMESEDDAWVARERPFGREYLNEQQERQKILAQNKNYRFVCEVAGALRKDPLQVMEEEDLARVMRERAQERREMEIELRRTKLTISEKSAAVRQLEALLVEVRERYNRAQAARANSFMLELSDQLIDRHSRTGLLRLVERVQEYRLIARMQPGSLRSGSDYSEEIARIERFDEGENQELQDTMAQFAASLPARYFAFIFYVYQRDFLDNENDQPMAVLFKEMRDYASLVEIQAAADKNAKEVPIPEALLSEQGGGPLAPLIDWEQYRGMETLDMERYAQLGLGTATEQVLVSHLKGGAYSDEALEKLANFAYATGERPDLRQAAYARLIPLVDRLSVRTNDTYRLLIRSHLLWLHYSEVGLGDLVSVLTSSQLRAAVAAKIVTFATDLAPQLEALLERVYVPLVDLYLAAVAKYMGPTLRGITGEGVVFNLPDVPVSLTGAQESYRQVDRLVQDAQFREYLQRGDAIFRTQKTTDSESTALRLEAPPDQYQVLILHLLFRQYQRYLAAYSLFTEQELQQGEKALAQARQKMASMLGEERIERSSRADPLLYQQRKSFTGQPINSGFVQFKAEILALIRRAWHNTQSYAAGLRGLPLEGFHCEAAFTSGLCTRFCEYVAALYAYKDLSINQQYNSQHHTAHCHKVVWEAFHPLHAYSWAARGTNEQGEQDYYIGGGSPVGSALMPAPGQYSLAPF